MDRKEMINLAIEALQRCDVKEVQLTGAVSDGAGKAAVPAPYSDPIPFPWFPSQ